MFFLKFFEGINFCGMYLFLFYFCVNFFNFILVMFLKGVNELWICIIVMYNNKRVDKFFIFDVGGVVFWFFLRVG